MIKKNRLILGISGKIGSGKDTVAYYLQDKFPEHNFLRRAYAFNVKKTVALLTGVDMATILTREGKQIYVPSFDKTIGQMLQVVGDNMRTIDGKCWIKSLYNREDKDTNLIITDVRYINEADDIKERGGVLIKVTGDPIGANRNDTRNKIHISETELDDYDKWDIVFENKPPIENIYKLINILKQKYNF